MAALCVAVAFAACAPKGNNAEEPAPAPEKSEPSVVEPEKEGAAKTDAQPGDEPQSTGKAEPSEGEKATAKQNPPWVAAESEAGELGKKVDAAVAGLKDTAVQLRFLVNNPEQDLQGQLNGQFIVEDETKFFMNYTVPESPERTERAVADGSRYMWRRSGKWSEPKPVESRGASPATGKQLVDAWPRAFPRHVFGALMEDRPTWGPLLEALERGEGGYTTKVERQEFKQDGKTVPFYRVVAERAGPRPQTIEMRFQGQFMLPVTIRLTQKLPDGKEALFQWQASYNFQEDVSKQNFTLPTSR